MTKRGDSVFRTVGSAVGSLFSKRRTSGILKYLIIGTAAAGAAKLLGSLINGVFGKIPFIGKVIGGVLSTPFNLFGKLFIPMLIILIVYVLFKAISGFIQRKKGGVGERAFVDRDGADTKEAESDNAVTEGADTENVANKNSNVVNVVLPNTAANDGGCIPGTDRIDSFD